MKEEEKEAKEEEEKKVKEEAEKKAETKESSDAKAEAKPEEKKVEEPAKEAEQIEAEAPKKEYNFPAMNPNVLCELPLGGSPEEITEDENRVKTLTAFLMDTMIPILVGWFLI
jgi:hypothetical protein